MSDDTIRIKRIYYSMKDRCYNPNTPCYKDYGGRGITICQEWLNDINSFISWALDNGYRENLSIDRLNNNCGYSPKNCRWATNKSQANNRRSNRIIVYDGREQTLKQWCEELGLSYITVYQRLYSYGWSVENAFRVNRNPCLKMITYKGKTQSMKRWCDELGLSYKTIQARIKYYHWPVERAFEIK